ncbi:MAG: hypothetical protein V7752_20985, partial [Halopseudomonas sp.]
MQSDDESISAPIDVSVFGCYIQFGTRYSVDVPVLFNQYGLNETGSGRLLPLRSPGSVCPVCLSVLRYRPASLSLRL